MATAFNTSPKRLVVRFGRPQKRGGGVPARALLYVLASRVLLSSRVSVTFSYLLSVAFVVAVCSFRCLHLPSLLSAVFVKTLPPKKKKPVSKKKLKREKLKQGVSAPGE
ncbi:hypothetical protein GW17_00042184 [Ensete ventricosum]|nr:hypothetical protein GW17_00042184 [Ensete ventricosum]